MAPFEEVIIIVGVSIIIDLLYLLGLKALETEIVMQPEIDSNIVLWLTTTQLFVSPSSRRLRAPSSSSKHFSIHFVNSFLNNLCSAFRFFATLVFTLMSLFPPSFVLAASSILNVILSTVSSSS